MIVITPVHIEPEFFDYGITSFDHLKTKFGIFCKLIIENSVYILDVFQVTFDIFKWFC